MSRQVLDSIFNPRIVAVAGASDQPGSVGGSVFRNLLASPFHDRAFAINRKHPVVQGQTAYPSLEQLPELPDLLVVCTPAATVAELARDFGQRGGRGMVVISAGFHEAGAVGRGHELDLLAAKREFPNLRIVGPNCLGILRPSIGLNASFSPVMPRAGGIAFLSQSGALVTGILDWSVDREIGFSACVSTGNMMDVSMGDLIDHFAADEQTEALILYIEGMNNPRHFMAAARACTRRKPILAYKSGRFAESSKAAASHTGAIASMDAVYDAAFRRAGIERVNSIEELFDCARLLVGRNHTSGNRLAIVTNAGGPGVMACDAWLARNGRLAQLDRGTIEALDQLLPSCWSHGNPLDVLGDASAERYQAAIGRTLEDSNVDALLVILTPQTMTEPERIADVVIQASATTSKPIVASWIGGPAVEAGRQKLKDAGVPVYEFPDEASDALAHLTSSGRLRESAAIYLPISRPSSNGLLKNRGTGFQPVVFIGESQVGSLCHEVLQPTDNREGNTSRELVEPNPAITATIPTTAEVWHARLAKSPGMLGEVHSKELFSDYGIPVVQTRVAHSADEAVAMADRLTYPVVMKVLSPEISHKTDAGGVLLNLADADAVRAGYSQIVTAVRNYNPQANIEGIAVQRMVSAARGVELLLGMTRDPQFGPVILLGAGGVTAELQRDSVLEIPPLDDSRIDRMLRSLRMYPLLEGYRGRPGVNLPRLREVVANFVQLVEDLPEISTAEINPMLVTAEEVIALDARLLSDGKLSAGSETPPQLAICPYPLEWHWNIELRDGTPITIRPTHPGDEPALTAWTRRPDAHAWLSNSESVWWADLQRFPERGCYLDYDREMALVARDDWGDWCGVMRLHRLESALNPAGAAETSTPVSVAFDMLVRDSSRGAGLGTILLGIGVEIAKQWHAGALECCRAELGATEADWLRRHGFVQQPVATGVRFRKPLP